MKERKKAIINILLLFLTLVINALGALGLINGYSQKEVSDRYLTLITPSPTTFSIWSIIYILVILSCILMIIRSDNDYYKNVINRITSLFRFSSLFNILWIISFSYLQLELSVIFIVAFLFSLSLILEKLLSIKSKGHFIIPLSFGISDTLWAFTILIVAVVIVFLVNVKNKNAVFPLPIAWAYFGINNFLKSSQGFSGSYPILEKASIVGMILLIMISIFRFYKNNYKIIPTT